MTIPTRRRILVAVAVSVGALGAGPSSAPFTDSTPVSAIQGAGAVSQVTVAGVAGVAGNASAVAVNLTALDATRAGYVTAWPCGSPQPTTSNLNFQPGAAVANSAIVRVGTGGKICLFNDNPANLIVDINGWYPASSDYQALNPSRLLDTRTTGRSGAGAVSQVTVAGVAGVAGNASAVAVNLTALDATRAGYVTAWPCGSPQPTTSNLNFQPGAAVANSAIVRVGTGGKICLFNDNPANLIVDINGWYPASSDYQALNPSRLLDTRTTGRSGAGAVSQVTVAGVAGVAGNASAVVRQPHRTRRNSSRLRHCLAVRITTAHHIQPQLPARSRSRQLRHRPRRHRRQNLPLQRQPRQPHRRHQRLVPSKLRLPSPQPLPPPRHPHHRPIDERPIDERPIDERPIDERPIDEWGVVCGDLHGEHRIGAVQHGRLSP